MTDLIDKDIPSVETSKDKWKFIGMDSMTNTYLFECPECGTFVKYPVFSQICGYNFCPYCGADMRGEE